MHDKKKVKYAGNRSQYDVDGRKKDLPVFTPLVRKEYGTAEFGKNARYYEKLVNVGIHLAVLFYVWEHSSIKSMEFSFGDNDKDKMADTLGKSIPSCRRSIKELYESDLIRSVGTAKYMLDPTMFYKGKETDKPERIKRFTNAKKYDAKVRSKESVDD